MITENEFIFSVKYVFLNMLDGKKGFYIAPYQRGFKWGKYVGIMLQDIFNACEKDSDKDYYLNFISIKEAEIDGNQYIELIDGQQRITTIALFWSIIYRDKDSLGIMLSPNYDGIDCDLTSKILISRQGSTPMKSLLDLQENVPDTQDNFYLRDAIKEIISFLKDLKSKNYNFQKYLNYFSNHVKIIINEENQGISAAEIFGNLNSNKVDLTETYLVKGLLLSLASRDTDNKEQKRYREIMETRTVMGRLWDEIYYWTDSLPIKLFFFGATYSANKSFHPMDLLIELTADELKIEIDNTSSDPYPVFNSLYRQINKYELANKFLEALKTRFWFLKRLYESRNNSIYNLLGLLLYFNGNNLLKRLEVLKVLSSKKDDDEIFKYLKEKHLLILQSINVEDLIYKKSDLDIYKVLLTISALDDNLGIYTRFNFFNFLNSSEGWSIEHIFPQNITISKQSKQYLDNWIETILNDRTIKKDDVEKFKEITNKIFQLEDNEDDTSTLEQLRQEATHLFEVIVEMLDIETDSIGNLVLLGLVDNIRLSNTLFEEKKYRLLSYIGKGSFVPEHTFSVFNKSIIDNNSLIFEQNNVWTNREISKHKQWLKARIDSILIKLN